MSSQFIPNKALILSLFLTAIFTISVSHGAKAGDRTNGTTGFVLFDLFSQAPNSKYRHPSAKVRGFRQSVGGYSYKFSDTLNSTGSRPNDFGRLYDNGIFSPRLGVDGPYTGD